MKRIASILLAILMMAALTALAEPAQQSDFSTFDHRVGYAGSDYYYYGFPDIRLLMPRQWDTLMVSEQRENGVSFYHAASHEKYLEEGIETGGLLFELCASQDESFRELPAYAELGYSENAGLYFYLALPTDYPAYTGDAAIQAEYDAMAEEIELVVQKAEITMNMYYYTEGVEHTDAGMS